MILRRITQHVKDQNWFAVALDFFIVIAGILIAFQITNWNEARLERKVEREILLRLHADFVVSIEGQRRDIAFLEQQLEDQQIVLQSLSACKVRDIQDNRFQRGIVTQGWINPPRLYRRTIDEIAAAGRTNIIRNPDITNELDSIVALVEWRNSAFESLMQQFESYRREVEPYIRYDMKKIIENPFVPGQKGGIEYDIQALCQDAKIANAVSAASFYTNDRLEAYRPILARYEDFLPLITTELEKRWNTSPEAKGDID